MAKRLALLVAAATAALWVGRLARSSSVRMRAQGAQPSAKTAEFLRFSGTKSRTERLCAQGMLAEGALSSNPLL
jgi:hypothetical protein